MASEQALHRPRRFGLSAPMRRGLLPILGATVLATTLLMSLSELGTQLGVMTSGLLTLGGMLMAAAYALRRRFLRLSLYTLRPFAVVPFLRPLQHFAAQCDQLRNWRVAHLIIGLVCIVPLWWHVQAAHGGVIEQLLFGCVVLVIGSGLFGALVQYLLPQSLLSAAERQVRMRDVQEKQRELYVEAEEQILGHKTDNFIETYLAEVKPVLLQETPVFALCQALLLRKDLGARLQQRLILLLERLEQHEHEAFQHLIGLAEEKVRLDVNLFQLSLTTGWLVFHDAVIVVGGGLTLLHIIAVLYFGER